MVRNSNSMLLGFKIFGKWVVVALPLVVFLPVFVFHCITHVLFIAADVLLTITEASSIQCPLRKSQTEITICNSLLISISSL